MSIRVPSAVLREAYAALVAAEHEAAHAPPGTQAAKRWYAAMSARVSFGIYVMQELDNTEAAPFAELNAT